MIDSRALGPTSLGLPIVVARTDLLVAVEARRHAQAFPAALLAEEHARLVVLSLRAPFPARVRALYTTPNIPTNPTPK